MLGFLFSLNFWMRLGAISALLISIGLFLLFKFQDKIVYIPSSEPYLRQFSRDNPPGMRLPSEYGLAFEEVKLLSGGQKLEGWVIFAPGTRQASRDDGKTAVVFFHENAGNLGIRLPFFTEYAKALDCHVAAFAYRGFGSSEGTPSEPALQEDGLAIFEWIFSEKGHFHPSRLLLHGRSMGGAVLLYALANSPHASSAKRVILESTFTSIADIVDVVFPPLKFLYSAKRWLLRNEWDSRANIRKVKCPQAAFLFIGGGRDQLTPPKMLSELFERCPSSSKTIRMIPEGDHNQTWSLDPSGYFAWISALAE